VRTITASFRKEAEAQFSPEADLCFITISATAGGAGLYFVWDTKDYIYNGNTFIGFPFDITILSDDEGPPKAQIAIQNVSTLIGLQIQGLKGPPRLKIELLSTLDFNIGVDPRTAIGTPTVAYSFDKAFMVNIKVDFLTVTADIVGWDYLQRVWPGKRATQNLFPGLFR